MEAFMAARGGYGAGLIRNSVNLSQWSKYLVRESRME